MNNKIVQMAVDNAFNGKIYAKVSYFFIPIPTLTQLNKIGILLVRV